MKRSILPRLAGIVAAAALVGGMLVAPLGGLSMSQAAPGDQCQPVGSDRVVYSAIPGSSWVRESVVRDNSCGQTVTEWQTVVYYSNPWVHGSTVVTVDRDRGWGWGGSVVTTYPCWHNGRMTTCQTTVTW